MRVRRVFGGAAEGQRLTLDPAFNVVYLQDESSRARLLHLLRSTVFREERPRVGAAHAPPDGFVVVDTDAGRSITRHAYFSIKEPAATDAGARVAGKAAGSGMLRNEPGRFLWPPGLCIIRPLKSAGLPLLETLSACSDQLRRLVDSGGGCSLSRAIEALEDHIAAIGRPTSLAKPFPALRARRLRLRAELRCEAEERERAMLLARERANRREGMRRLETRRTEVCAQLDQCHWGSKRALLRQADALRQKIEALERDAFRHRGAADFPGMDSERLQRLAALETSHEKDVARTRAELDSLNRETAVKLDECASNGTLVMNEPDPDLERRLADAEREVDRYREHVESLERSLSDAQDLLESDTAELERLPDFGAAQRDPVAAVSDLAGELEALRDECVESATRVEQWRADYRCRADAVAQLEELFLEYPDFEARLERHRDTLSEYEDAIRTLERETADVARAADEAGHRVPPFVVFASAGLAGTLFLSVVAILTRNWGVMGVSACTGMLFVYFTGAAVYFRRRALRLSRRRQTLESETEGANAVAAAEREHMAGLMECADCSSLRELEAIYTRFTVAKDEIAGLERAIADEDARLGRLRGEAQTRFDAIQAELSNLGVPIERESDLRDALVRIAGDYQRYKDLKRSQMDARDLVYVRRGELDESRRRLDAAKQKDVELSLETRHFLRENNFSDEDSHESALKALRAYRIRSAQMRQKRHAVDISEGKRHIIERRLAAKIDDLQTVRRDISQILAAADVESPQEYLDRAKQARKYQQTRQEHARLQEQFNALAGDEDLDALRERLDGFTAGESLAANEQQLRDALAGLERDLDTREKEIHRIDLELATYAGAERSRSALEEALQETDRQIHVLEERLRAAAQATALLREALVEHRAGIATLLGRCATRHLRAFLRSENLTVVVDATLEISLPQTEFPGRSVEPGWQLGQLVHLALRLGLVEVLCGESERAPLILDDPLSSPNPDLLRRVIRGLSEVGRRHQVIYLTRYGNVAEFGRNHAQAVGNP